MIEIITEELASFTIEHYDEGFLLTSRIRKVKIPNEYAPSYKRAMNIISYCFLLSKKMAPKSMNNIPPALGANIADLLGVRTLDDQNILARVMRTSKLKNAIEGLEFAIQKAVDIADKNPHLEVVAVNHLDILSQENGKWVPAMIFIPNEDLKGNNNDS